MAAMFSNTRNNQASNGHIIEFKAGKSNMEPGSSESKRKVVADKRKGLVYIKQTNDLLVHFCWMSRENQAVEDDLIIFPGDTEFKEVKGCPDGKVYMLKFKSSKEMRLYWLQDGSTEIEADLIQKVNDALNKTPSRPAARGNERMSAGTTAASNFSSSLNLGGEEYGNGLSTLDQQHLISLIQSLQGSGSDALPSLPASSSARNSQASTTAAVGGSTDTPTTPTTPSSTGAINKTNLSKILSSIRTNARKQQTNVSLSDAICNDSVMQTARGNSDTLQPHLPQTSNTPEKELEETMRAPQFRQATDSFGHALQTGQLGPVLSQFGLNSDTVQAANSGNLREFARNLTIAEGGEVPAESDKDESPKEPEAKRGRPDDDMDVD